MANAISAIQGETDTGATGQTFAFSTSFLPVAGRTYLVVARFTRGTTFNSGVSAVTHGGSGLTLARLAGTESRSQEGAITLGHQVCAYVGTATGSPTTGVFTLDAGSTNTTSITSRQYELFEITGNDTTTPIPQDDTFGALNNNTSATQTFTLAGAFVNAGSFTISALATANGTTDPTIPTGWTSLSNRTNSTPSGRLTVAYYGGNDSTADWSGLSTGGTEDLCGFIAEIAEAAAGGGSYGNKLYGPLGGKLVGKV